MLRANDSFILSHLFYYINLILRYQKVNPDFLFYMIVLASLLHIDFL